MAAVGRRLQVVTDGEATVLRQVETVVDERTGLIQQRERIAYGVETEDGDMAVYVQDRVETARVPRWIERSLTPSTRRPPAITSGPRARSRGQQQDQTDTHDSLVMLLFKAFCVLSFLPCTCTNFLTALLLIATQLIVWGLSVIGIVFTVLGPFKCQNDELFYYGSILNLILLGTIALISALCLCFALFSNKENCDSFRSLMYFLVCIFVLFFLMVLAIDSSLVFNNYDKVVNGEDSCKFSVTFFGIVLFSYSLIIYFVSCWFMCFCFIKNKK